MRRLTCAVALLASLVGAQAPPAATPAPVRIEGRVVDMRGEPVPAAEVWVVSAEEPDRELVRSTCDGEGLFVLRAPPRAGWLVRATAAGHTVGEDYVLQRDPGATIVLHDVATVRGVLRDRAGRPVAGVRVQAAMFARSIRGVFDRAVTDANGAFTLAKVPLAFVTVGACVPGEGLAAADVAVRSDCEVVLSPGSDTQVSLDIRVAGLSKADARAASIRLTAWDESGIVYLPEPWERPKVDDEGHCLLEHMPDLRYEVAIVATGIVAAPLSVELQAGKGPHRAEFTAAKKGSDTLAMKARLHDAAGKGIAGVRLALRPAAYFFANEAVTDGDGVVRFDCSYAAGSKVVIYSLDDAWVMDQEQPVSEWLDARNLVWHRCELDPAATVDLRAIAPCKTTGRLLCDDGRPAPFARVQLEEEEPNDEHQWMPFAWSRTDHDGRFLFRRLHHLQRRVRVTFTGTVGAVVGEPCELTAPGTTLDVGELRLAKPAIVEGVVRDAANKPVPGLRVWLLDWDLATNRQRSGSVTEVLTDRLGRYRFVGVPLGGAWLELCSANEAKGEQRASDPFEVAAGQTCTHDLTLKE